WRPGAPSRIVSARNCWPPPPAAPPSGSNWTPPARGCARCGPPWPRPRRITSPSRPGRAHCARPPPGTGAWPRRWRGWRGPSPRSRSPPAGPRARRWPPASAAAALARAQEAERDVRGAGERVTERAARLRLRLAEVHGAEESYDRLVEATETVVRLAGLARGMEGHRRVALTTYVLRHWFEQVVA